MSKAIPGNPGNNNHTRLRRARHDSVAFIHCMCYLVKDLYVRCHCHPHLLVEDSEAQRREMQEEKLPKIKANKCRARPTSRM